MKTKPVYIKENDEVEVQHIPIIDGERGIPSISWGNTKEGEMVECFGSAQFALEQEIDDHIKEFMLALMPYVEWLKEEGFTDYVERAINAALSQRNSRSHSSRVQGAKIMSDLVPHYRTVAKAAKNKGYKARVHAYSPYVVILSNEADLFCCIEIEPSDSTYDAGWTDGYHVSCIDDCTTDIDTAIERAIRIAEESDSDE